MQSKIALPNGTYRDIEPTELVEGLEVVLEGRYDRSGEGGRE